jgi:hypothetical protein
MATVYYQLSVRKEVDRELEESTVLGNYVQRLVSK